MFIAEASSTVIPKRFKVPSITKAKELIAAGRVLADASALRCVVDLPDDLDCLDLEEKRAIDRFLVCLLYTSRCV